MMNSYRKTCLFILAGCAALFMGCGDYTAWSEKINQTIYSVVYDGNGSEGGVVPVDENEYEEGDTVTVLGVDSLVLSGKYFGGWILNGNGGVIYTAGTQFTLTRDATLSAVWADSVTVIRYVDENGEEVVQTAASGSTTLLLPEEPAKEGFIFLGWATTEDAEGMEYEAGQAFECGSSAVTLYPVWSPITTVSDSYTYSSSNNSVTVYGYSGSDTSVELPSEVAGFPVTAIGRKAFAENATIESVSLPSSVTSIGKAAFSACASLVSVTLASATPPSLGSGAFDGCTSLKHIYVPDGSYEAYANDPAWSAYLAYLVVVQGTITYSSGVTDSSGEMTSLTLAGGTSDALRANAFVRSGYVFSGWATSAGASSVAYADGADYTMIKGSATLYAVWTATNGIKATISIPTGSSVAIAGSLTVDKGDTLTLTVQESFAAYRWYLDGARQVGATGASITVSTDSLAAGTHELLVAATDDDGELASGSCRFTVRN